MVAFSAFAQAVIPNQPEAEMTAPATMSTTAPVNAYPAAPMAPTVAPVTMAPAGVTSTPAMPASTTLQTAPTAAPSQPFNLNAMVSKFANSGNASGNSNQQLGQVMVVGSIMGCTQKIAGKEATDAFYQQMQAVGKTVSAYCKQNDAADAKATVLSTLQARQNDPVAKAALGCYEQQKANVLNLGGAQVAADAEHYARWLKNPALAKQEMQDSDICRKGKK